MTSREIDKYFTGKLKYARDERRHVHFFPCLDGKKLPLPTVIALTRGSGDVADRVVGGIARSLGLRENDFRTSVRCEIGAACVYLCQVGYCIEFCSSSLVLDPQVYRENVMAMEVSISYLLHNGVDLIMKAKCWNTKERSALDSLIRRLTAIAVAPEMKTSLESLRRLIRKGLV